MAGFSTEIGFDRTKKRCAAIDRVTRFRTIQKSVWRDQELNRWHIAVVVEAILSV
ncbi:hypothetical protein BGZ50_002470, partial [Haplosporangium sp. Z 11]